MHTVLKSAILKKNNNKTAIKYRFYIFLYRKVVPARLGFNHGTCRDINAKKRRDGLCIIIRK